MAAMIQTAQAAFTGTLYDLANGGGSLTIDHKLFSDFSFTDSGLTSFDAHNIIVTASDVGGVEYLTWSGDMSLSSAGIASADLKLNYKVTVTPGGNPIDWIDQSFTGSAQHGFLAVDETAHIGAPGGLVVGSSHLEVGDFSDPPPETVQGDNLTINPWQNVLYITKDIGFSVNSPNGGFITISEVSQSFHQVPEPTTVIAGALLLLPFGASTLRILRKNRTA
jgi:hypothetical protein